MNLTIPFARLVQERSDELDWHLLVNQMRDVGLNQNACAWRTIATADATPTSIWSDTLNANMAADIWAVFIGEDAAGNIASYTRRVVVKRVGTGAVSYIGAGTDIIGADKENIAGWDAGFALDATIPDTIFAYVLGAAATAISWRCYIRAVCTPWE